MRPSDRLSRRALAKAGLLGAAGAPLLTSCGIGGGGEMVLSDEPVELRLSWWGSDLRAQQTNEAIAAFQAEHPNITVRGEYKEFGAYWDGLATTFAANDSPDVVQMDEQYFKSYSDRGALVDLNEAAEFLDLSKIDANLLPTGQVDGAQFALPIGSGVLAFAVNADLFAQYELDLPDDTTWTWDDYAAISLELTERSGGEITGSGITGGVDVGSIRYWTRQRGNELFAENGDVTVEPELLVELWEYYLGLIDSGACVTAEQMVEDTGAGVEGGMLATGRTAFGQVHNTQITALRKGSGADMRLLQLPQHDGTPANFVKPGMYWAVSAGSEHPAEASLLVDFLVNTKAAADIIGTERGVPANTEILEYLIPQLDESDRMAVDYLEATVPGDPLVVVPNGASNVNPLMTRLGQEVYFEETSPEDAAEAFITELQGEVDAAK
ncbi:ABC transporter substrate-binding protein [Glycomyces harbinensis]|uniref:Multiple sugar transport system substrate-binding protein n=1 Tax=Glycomyces harbinensis TaxID=58114 RepID=A0A1G7ATJ4_9ACTN|nr:extracellular solute-binding protein [Glycomyces harbinensis]SDE18204.1 multiple sugar transport system substrate-binding protein [Glycomyces harbinensis]